MQKTLVEKGVTITRALAHEAIAKINGFASWNVAAQAAAPTKALAALPATSCSPSPHPSSVSVFEINMADILPEYDTPDECCAWNWVQQNASFSHTENGIGAGVWEFMVLSSKLKHDSSQVPETLRSVVQEGLDTGAKWLLFYQW